jgi:hypothetical protein
MTLTIIDTPAGGVSVSFDGDPAFLDQCVRAIDELLDALTETAPDVVGVE